MKRTSQRLTRCFLGLLALSALACSSKSSEPILEATDAQGFADYWHQGKAELTRYQLNQARYGEQHEGDAVLIFVTEDFLDAQQVKRDYGNEPASPILKLNATRKFNTGIYPYSLMTSIFTKADFEQPETPKVTFSGQEWCGHVFMQLNRRDGKVRAQMNSYFQSEGDQQFNLPDAPLEDGIWTTLRLAPNQLPKGELEMIPALHFLRLQHVDARAYAVKAELAEVEANELGTDTMLQYTLAYPDLQRSLTITFERASPHRILGWREVSNVRGREMVTTARRTHELMSDYWSKNGTADLPLRSELGLE